MTAPEQAAVAMLTAIRDGSDDALEAACEMLNDFTNEEVSRACASLASVALAISERLADSIGVPREALLDFYLDGLGQYAVSSP